MKLLDIILIALLLLFIGVLYSVKKDSVYNIIHSRTNLKYKVYYEYNVYNLQDTIPVDTVYIKIK